MTEQTVFALSSITKVFTATLVARLVQQGRLAYDDFVVDHLRDFALVAGQGRSITIRHLVTHTGGFEGPDGTTAESAGASAAEFVEALGGFPPYAAPGAMFGYSSAGYVVLAAIIERITSLGYIDALRREVLGPLDLQVSNAHGFSPEDIAVGYDVRAGAVETPVPAYPPGLDAAGGLWATSDTAARFGEAFFDHGLHSPASALLNGDVLADVVRPVVDRPDGASEQLAQGLIWRHVTWDGEPILWHTGGGPGHASKLTVVPTRGLSIAITTNAELNIGHRVTGPLEEWLLYHLAGVERPELPAPMPPALPLAAYEGEYRRHSRTFHVAAADGSLRVASVPTKFAHPRLRRNDRTLIAVGDHTFRDENGATYHFAADDADRPSHLVSKGWVARRALASPSADRL